MQLEEFLGVDPPPYAILSHTWENEEVSFGEMSSGPSEMVRAKKGYTKIKQTCRIAAQQKLRYAWVDTCCIDKSSSAELTEAINSMFQWYERSAVCYAYLSDLDPHTTDEFGFPKCRWFTRGWTLQELIAPSELVFYDSRWGFRTTKERATYLISQITRIDSDYLWHRDIVKFASVAKKMSWASRRQTTRVEDMAYCLLGLFDLNMPLLYGEGMKAFLRLQGEIVRRTNDLSLLAWKPLSVDESCCGVLAASPLVFQSCGTFCNGSREKEFSVTNKGIRITTQLRTTSTSKEPPHFLLYLCDDEDLHPVYLILQKWGADQYVRDNSINGGVWHSASSFSPQLLRMESTYLVHDPRKITKDALEQKRLGSTRLELQGELKAFEVIPEGVWDPAHSLLLDPSVPVALLLGFSSSPYGSIQVIILSKRTKHTTYVLPASSPAIPYVHANLSTLTGAELKRHWNLEPVSFDDNFFSRCSIGGNVTVDIAARFREVYAFTLGEITGRKVLQLNHLSVTATSSPNTRNHRRRNVFFFITTLIVIYGVFYKPQLI